MKKILVVTATAVLVLAAAGSVLATNLAPSPLVNVTATVQAKCTWFADGALTIAIDPSIAGAQAMTPTQPSVKCTNGRALAVSAKSTNSGNTDATGSVVGSLTHAGLTAIPYTFTFTAAPSGNGFGSGADVNFSIAGSVAQTDAQAAQYSTTNYTDTVTLTVAY